MIRGASHEQHDQQRYEQLVSEQIERMDQIVQYQLSRAVKSQHPAMGKAVAVTPLVERMLSALGKVYRNKAIHSQLDMQPALNFYGDERDLMELLGNILENAFKYGHSQVSIRGRRTADALQLEIGDDGPGSAPRCGRLSCSGVNGWILRFRDRGSAFGRHRYYQQLQRPDRGHRLPSRGRLFYYHPARLTPRAPAEKPWSYAAG